MLNKKKDRNLNVSIIITVCFIIVAAVVYIVRNFNYSKEVILQKANNYFINGQYFIAAKYFAKAINLNASGLDLYKNYGASLLKLGNYDLALKYFKMVLNLEPYNYDNYYCIGDVLYHKAYVSNSKEIFLQAIEYLEKGIILNRNSEKLYLLIGLCCRSCGLYSNARVFYNRALLSGKFSHAGFYNLIGNTFREECKYQEALSYYKKAKECDSSFVGACCNIGDMCLKSDDEESALLNYHEAVKIDKHCILPYISIANLYYDRNNFLESKNWALKALKINKDNDKANYILGMSYKNLDMREEGIKYLKLAAFCGNVDAVYELRTNGIDLR